MALVATQTTLLTIKKNSRAFGFLGLTHALTYCTGWRKVRAERMFSHAG